jgi:hypothetical protein
MSYPLLMLPNMCSINTSRSVPGPGRTLIGTAEAWGKPVRRAVALLSSELETEQVQTLRGLFHPLDLPADREFKPDAWELVSWSLVSLWLVTRSIRAIRKGQGFAEALEWFAPGVPAPPVNPRAERSALESLESLAFDDRVGDLLPYVLDRHEPGTRRAVLRDASNASTRNRRKSSGIFYTPSDVAEFMVGKVFQLWGRSNVPLVIDPACGSGVFLRAALRHQVSIKGTPVLEALGKIFGTDIDPLAVNACAFVLLHEALSLQPEFSLEPWRVWHLAKLNLLAADSLAYGGVSSRLQAPANGRREDGRRYLAECLRSGVSWQGLAAATTESPVGSGFGLHFSQLFPEVHDGFDVVVANPPYAPLGDRSDLADLEERFRSIQAGASPATNTYVPFVELMWTLSKSDGAASMVLPLSLAYSSKKQVNQLRRAIMDAGGSWYFAFFDRTPDALFGDDVKQRTCIVFRHASSKHNFWTGPLLRWTSRTRKELFNRIAFTRLISTEITERIPKLGSRIEAKSYGILRDHHELLFGDLLTTSRTTFEGPPLAPNELMVAGTAYNWLSVYRSSTEILGQLKRPSRSPLTRLEFETPESADAFYAVLASRLIYWVWRVEGDGFHVPISFLLRIPIGTPRLGLGDLKSLARYGLRLWDQIRDYPVRSVNGGRESVSFCPYPCGELLDSIDQVLIASLGLPDRFGEELRQFVLKNAVVDLDDPLRNGLGSRPLAAWRLK